MFYNFFPVTGFPTCPRGLCEGEVNACDALKGGALRKNRNGFFKLLFFSFCIKALSLPRCCHKKLK